MSPSEQLRSIRRVEVMHGVNLDMLGRRDPDHYGTLTLMALEQRISGWAERLDMEVRFLQTNAEHEFVEHLHSLPDLVDGVILNPGAWTHYAYSIHDALELTGLPAIEVHLSDVQAREPWRKISVVADLCLATYSGKGPEGYRLALERLRKELDGGVPEPDGGASELDGGASEPDRGVPEPDGVASEPHTGDESS